MATEVFAIKGTLDLDSDKFNSKLDKSGGRAKKFAGIAVKALAGVGIAAGIALGASIKRAGDFETKLANLSTLLSGDSTEAVNEYKEGILALTKVIPKSADELGAAAYQILSSGITDTSRALKVLKSSSKLAVAGLGSTEEATTLMTLALNNFSDSGVTAEKAAELMFKTVRGGITTVAELSQSFGLVAPLAVDAGISLEELQAATAALTQVNKSASISQNSIKAALVSLAKPTKEAQTLFEGLGVKTFPELIKKSGGMVAAFKAMKDETKGNSQQFAKAIGSGEALTSVLSLLGTQSGSFKESLASMKDESNELDVAFDKQSKTFNNSMTLLKNSIDSIAISVGSQLLPPLANFAKTLSENLGPAIDMTVEFVKDLIAEMGGWKNIVAQIGPPLNALVMVISTLLWPALLDIWNVIKKDLLPAMREFWKEAGPVLIPILKFLAVVFGVIVVGAIMATLKQIRILIKVFSFVVRVVSFVVKAVKKNLADMKRSFKILVSNIKWIVRGVKDAITRPFRDAFNWVKNNIGSVTNALKKLNPFSRSSPSLVDMVTKGTGRITDLYGDMFKNIGDLSGGFSNELHGGTLAGVGDTTNSQSVVTNISGPINIGSEVQADNFLERLSRNTELAKMGLTIDDGK